MSEIKTEDLDFWLFGYGYWLLLTTVQSFPRYPWWWLRCWPSGIDQESHLEATTTFRLVQKRGCRTWPWDWHFVNRSTYTGLYHWLCSKILAGKLDWQDPAVCLSLLTLLRPGSYCLLCIEREYIMLNDGSARIIEVHQKSLDVWWHWLKDHSGKHLETK